VAPILLIFMRIYYYWPRCNVHS